MKNCKKGRTKISSPSKNRPPGVGTHTQNRRHRRNVRTFCKTNFIKLNGNIHIYRSARPACSPKLFRRRRCSSLWCPTTTNLEVGRGTLRGCEGICYIKQLKATRECRKMVGKHQPEKKRMQHRKLPQARGERASYGKISPFLGFFRGRHTWRI